MLDDDPWYATDVIMTVADEHREWHRINGPPESTVCPWDCYDPPEPERCVICAEYLHADESCSNTEKDWHFDLMLEHQSEMLHVTGEHDRKRAEMSTLVDPWF